MAHDGGTTEYTSGGPFYEVAIVGGGPAGLTAALWLARYLRRVVLVDSGDPRNWETRGINGYLGLPDVRPAELRGRGRDECRKYGVHLIDAVVERALKRSDDEFVLELHDGSVVRSQRLLLAIGIKDRWPRIPGLRQCYGDTAHVCPDCDGYEARGKKMVVVGTGRRAVVLALALTTWSPHIVVCTNGRPADMNDELCAKLDTLEIPVLTSAILCANTEGGEVRSLELEGGMELDCDRLFFTLGQRPPHPAVDTPVDVDPEDEPDEDLGDQLGCDREGERGSIKIDEHFHTTVRNVFAAGDITPGPQLAIRAATAGAVAAMVIHKSLLPPERTLD